MKQFWGRLTLMKYATDQDNGRIPLEGWLGSLLLALVCWAAWTVATWIASSP